MKTISLHFVSTSEINTHSTLETLRTHSPDVVYSCFDFIETPELFSRKQDDKLSSGCNSIGKDRKIHRNNINSHRFLIACLLFLSSQKDGQQRRKY
jgi:hypothetical protein